MAEFDPGLPSIRQAQKYIQDQQALEVKLLTGDVLTGRLAWQDSLCFCLLDAEETLVVVPRQAIAYYKPV
ncbi:MAG: RNA-binding protein hfq [Spirulinaceae cyanobacterium SM2_1_0]|nr:RNA-binding protein hfq [Spirulinaceae cyanobacterium SM2_1_0]